MLSMMKFEAVREIIRSKTSPKWHIWVCTSIDVVITLRRTMLTNVTLPTAAAATAAAAEHTSGSRCAGAECIAD